MPDSLQNITVDPAILQIEAQLKANNAEHEERVLRSNGSGERTQSSQTYLRLPVDTLPHREVKQPRKAIVITAHSEPQRPVSPRSTGSPTTSWVILGLIAVFMLVSIRYARNFKFLSGIGRELLSKGKPRKMFDDTVRETSFLIFLNLLCIVSVGVLLFGGIELYHPEVRDSVHWYWALGLVTASVGGYYLWQWLVYFIVGRTFGTRQDASSWMRGFSSGQGFLGLALFLPALISIFYSVSLSLLVVISGAAYVVMRILFVIKGIRIFLPRSTSWLPFFYYLCAVEVAPVVLLINLSTRLCLAVTT